MRIPQSVSNPFLEQIQIFVTKLLMLVTFLCRKSMQGVIASNDDTSPDIIANRTTGVFDVANLVLRLLPSKQGTVLRRLLMTAVSASELDLFVSAFRVFCVCFSVVREMHDASSASDGSERCNWINTSNRHKLI